MPLTYQLSDAQHARVLSESKQDYTLGFSNGRIERFPKTRGQEAYHVGDVVKIDHAETDSPQLQLVERRNQIVKARNTTAKDEHFSEADQVLATNVDQLFIVMALDQRFSLSKLERYLLVFSQEGIELTVVLTKKDLVPTYDAVLDQIEQLYPQIKMLAISIYDEGSLLALKEVLNPQQIGLFIGSSGAGKSSLINQLQSDYVAKVNAVRADHKGKHTTTSSLLIYCPEIDYYVIDTPGFKGIDTHHEIDRDILFAPIEDLAKSCKFSNCQHDTEPKCAVKAALEAGQLDHALFDRYRYQLGKMDLLSKRRKSWRL